MNQGHYGAARGLSYAACAALVVVACCCGGCQSSPYRKGDAAGKSLHSAAGQLRAESRAIDAAIVMLNDLVSQPAADLKPQFQRFVRALDDLEDAASRADRTREQMAERGGQYFDAWEREAAAIQFGIVREQSDSRRAAVTNEFHALNSRYLETQSAVRPLISYLNDIRMALNTDLTAAGLNSVKSIADNAERNAQKVQAALDLLADELAASGGSMSSVMAQSKPREGIAPSVEGKSPVRAETTR